MTDFGHPSYRDRFPVSPIPNPSALLVLRPGRPALLSEWRSRNFWYVDARVRCYLYFQTSR